VSGRRARYLSLFFLTSPLLLHGCGDAGDPQPPSTGEVTSSPTVVAPSPLASPASTPGTGFISSSAALGEIVWSTAIETDSKRPTTPVTSLTSDVKRIYAVIPVNRLNEGTTLTAGWTYNGTPIRVTTQVMTALRDTEDGWIEFHLAWTSPDPWPDGTYAISIQVDTQLALRSAIELVSGPSA